MPKRAKVSECNASMVYDIDNLLLAHKNARKGKTHYQEVQMVDSNPAKYLYELQDSIVNGTRKTSPYDVETKWDGNKWREIYKLPYFPDRVFQWAVIQVIEPFLLRNMTNDTYSALPGRGTKLAHDNVVKALRSDPKGTQWCLKINIRKYYPSIDKTILKHKYEQLFKDKGILDMLFEVIDSTPGNTGVPIGNYFSQYSGNMYLSEFDHKVKEQYKVKHYFRYMDDMVFLAETKEELQSLIKVIIRYMRVELHLEVKQSWSLFRVEDRGIDFVGYVFYHNKIRLRKSIALTVKRLHAQVVKRTANGKLINYHLYCGVNSMKGWLKNCNGRGLYMKYVATIEWYLDEYHDNVIVPQAQKERYLKCSA